MTLHEMLTKILERGGGYVDHPADRGGPTKYGITQATLEDVRGHAVTADDVKALTEVTARAIYQERYWREPGFNRVRDETLQALLLDAAVNHGPRAAVRMLQRALGMHGDGIMGPLTLAAIPYIDARVVALRLMAQRVRLYGAIITKDHSQAVFAAGWANRTAELLEGMS